VIVSEHRGRQTTETVATFGEARERKGEKDAGDRRPVSKVRFGSYFEGWIKELLRADLARLLRDDQARV
jgi:hypothetical protein